MFISSAFAQTATAAAPSLGGLPPEVGVVVPYLLIFLVIYMLLIRPRQKQQKQHRAMIEQLRRGDKVITAGGIFGVVTKVNDEKELTIEIADNVRIRVLRGSVEQVLNKSEPISDAKPVENTDKTKDK